MQTKKRYKVLYFSFLLTLTLIFLFSCISATKFELKFEVDGKIVHTIHTNGDETIKLPTDPTKEGYTFAGWYWDNNVWDKPLTVNSLLNVPLSSNMTVYAKWDKIRDPDQSFVIQFDSNGGTPVSDLEREDGETIATSPTTTKDGFTFSGWHDGETKIIFPYTVTKDTILKAKWRKTEEPAQSFVIQFDSNGGTPVSDLEREDGETIATSPTTTKDGFTFGGWYDGETKIIFPYTVTKDTILKAKWTRNNYTIKFEVDGGSAVSNIEREYLQVIYSKPDTTKKGYTFDGWYNGETKVDFPYTVTDDKTLTAKWIVKKYTITFEVGEGSIVNNIEKEYNQTIATEPITTRENYKFDGWYDKDTKVEFPYTITENKTLTAKWVLGEGVVEYAFNTNGGTAVNEVLFIINESPLTIRDGYIFLGWYDNEAFTGKPVAFPYTDKEKTKLNAKWISSSENLPLEELWNINGNILTANISFAYVGVEYFEIIPIENADTEMKDNIEKHIGSYNIAKVKNILKVVGELDYMLSSTGLKFVALELSSNINLESEPDKEFGGFKLSSYRNIVFLDVFENYDLATNLFIGNYKKIDNALYTLDEKTLLTVTDTNCQEFIIPSSVTIINDRAFQSYDNLATLIIPNSVTSIGSYAFYGCRNLRSLLIPNNVTSIGANAFLYCSELIIYAEAISNPSGWDSDWNPDNRPIIWNYNDGKDKDGYSYLIEENITYRLKDGIAMVFSASRNILTANIKTTVNYNGMSYNVTSIGSAAFYNCGSLTGIIIPNSITSIGSQAFYNCGSLATIIIPNSIIRIDNRAFSGCINLASITFEEGSNLSSIDNYAFDNCRNLTGIIIPNRVTNISIKAFQSCSSLESITVESGNSVYHSNGNCIIETANNKLILGCKNSFIPTDGSVTSISDSAFYGCSSLERITIPNSVVSIESYAFYGCKILTIYVEVESKPVGWTSNWNYDRPVIWNYKNEDKDENGYSYLKEENITYRLKDGIAMVYLVPTTITTANIKDMVNYNGINYSVTSFGNSVFNGCSSLTNITIPNSITSIGNNVFSNCSSLTNITIPNSVTSIGNNAFSYCSSLTSIIISNSITSISSNAFYNCSSLESIIIPNSVTVIGYSAFSNCSSLESIIIPNSVTDIGYSAFSNCSSLISITLSNSITSISSNVFYNCSSLEGIIIPNSVTSIGDSAFDGCSSLENITIPNSVISIGEAAFLRCTSLESIIIPNSVTSIGDIVFAFCSSLKSITFEESSQLSSLGMRTFGYCSSLTSITIPNSVSIINTHEFLYCNSLESIKIPKSVTSIGANAFYGCNNLTIYAEAESQPSGWEMNWNTNNIPVVWGAFESKERFTIDFISDEYSIANIEKEVGGTITTPPTATKEGHTFDGWYDGETKIIFPYTVTDNKTLTAKWIISKYTITFETDGGSAVSNIEKYYNQTIATEPITTKEGYTFDGWYDGETKIIFPYTVTDNKTLTAKWIISKYTITFETDGGSAVSNIEKYYNQTIETEPITTKEGYTFDGWYDGETKIIFPYTVTEDTTLKAKWIINKYTVTFEVDGGSTVDNIEKDYNQAIETEPITTKEGYTFDGWYDGETKVIFPYTVIANKTLKAKWTLREDIAIYTFNTNGGTAVNGGLNIINESPLTIKDGYLFLGWYDNEEFTGKPVIFPYSDKEKTKLNAKWISSSENLPLGELWNINGSNLLKHIPFTLGSEYFEIISIENADIKMKENIKQFIGNEINNVKNILKVVGALDSLLSGSGLKFVALELSSDINFEIASDDNYFSSYKNIVFLNIFDNKNSLINLFTSNYKKIDNAIYTLDEKALLVVTDTSCQEFIIPSGVENIENNAFQFCSNLTSIKIPNSVTRISAKVFQYCYKLIIYVEAMQEPSEWEMGWNNNRPVVWNYNNEGKDKDGYSYLIEENITYKLKDGIASVFNANRYIVTANIKSTVNDNGMSYNVTSIDSKAFNYHESLTSIIIPNSITSIGNYAFSNCSSLTSITFKEGSNLSRIGNDAFYNCKSLSSIIIPNTVSIIDSRTFRNCSNLVSITFEEGSNLSRIGNDAFNDCKSLESIIIPNSVTNIVGNVFSGCISLETITVERGNSIYHSNGNCLIETASKMLILGCKNSIIPTDSSVTSIGNYAFYRCRDLTNINIPNSVVKIESNAFGECNNLIIYVEVESKPSEWVNNWYNDSPVIWNYKNEDKDKYGYNYIIEENITYRLKDGIAMVYSAFTNITTANIKAIVHYNGMSYHVTSIKSNVFYECTSLTNIIIPNSLTSIGNNAFSNCSSLTSITFEEGSNLGSIGNNAFSNCSSLTSIIIPNSVTRIGESMFSDCSSLESIIIPNSVSRIGEIMFSNCSSLTSIIIPRGVSIISTHAFLYCNSLESIEIPKSVTRIDTFAFYGCSNLTIYAEAESQPSGWEINWNTNNIPVVWGAFESKERFSIDFISAEYSIANIEKEVGGTITSPPTVTKKGYTFDGWYDGETKIIFPYTVTENKTLTAKWIINKYTITFNVGEGSFVSNIERDYNQTIATEPITTKEGYTFDGWYDGETKIIFPYTVTDNKTLTAKWIENTDENLISLKELYDKNVTNAVSIFLGHFSNPMLDRKTTYVTKDSIGEELVLFESFLSNWEKFGIIGIKALVFNKDWNVTLVEFESNKLSKNAILKLNNSDLSNVYDIEKNIVYIDNGFFEILSDKYIIENGSYYSIDKVKLIIANQTMEEFIIPLETKIIVDSAFIDRKKLAKIILPNSLTRIGGNAFNGCSGLKSIKIPNSVILIGANSFSNCYDLVIYVESESSPVGWNFNWNSKDSIVIWDCNNNDKDKDGFIYIIEDNITYRIKDATGMIFTATKNITVANLKSTITYKENTYVITTIKDSAFTECRNLTSTVIPNSIKSIGNYAFDACAKLNKVTFDAESQLLSIGSSAFQHCSSLESISIPSSVTSIGGSAFAGTGIWNYTQKNSVVYAGKWAVGYNGDKSTALYLTLKSDTMGIADNAFRDCTKLKSITTLNNVKIIGFYAFYNCLSLISLENLNSLTSIGESSFGGCNSFETITFGEGRNLANISMNAFLNCPSLISIIIPNSVTSIGNNAFMACSSLTIYAEAGSQPSGWEIYWNQHDRPVVWGHKL